MKHTVTMGTEAERHLKSLTAREQRLIRAAVTKHLQYDPTRVSKTIKRLRPNDAAEFEFRVQAFRVLYNVDDANAEVRIEIIGRKVGNTLLVDGEAFHGHQDHTTP